MSLSGGMGSDEAGTWIVASGEKSHTVEADRWDYSGDGNLQMWKGQTIVAEFRWWDSIRRKGD